MIMRVIHVVVCLAALLVGILVQACLSDASTSKMTIDAMTMVISIVIIASILTLLWIILFTYEEGDTDNERRDSIILVVTICISYIGFGFFINR
jgi:hypothetical protein